MKPGFERNVRYDPFQLPSTGSISAALTSKACMALGEPIRLDVPNACMNKVSMHSVEIGSQC